MNRRKLHLFPLLLCLLAAPVALRAQTTRPGAVPAPAPGRVAVTIETYKKVGKVELDAVIYRPPGLQPTDKRPAIVFFSGGAWVFNNIWEFNEHGHYFASRGMVAVAADYRVKLRHNTTPFEAVADAKSMIRWLRQNAARLGVDPDRIVAAGASAGGHLAACTAVVHGFDEPGEDLRVSSVPDALVLYCPALDLTPGGYPYIPERAKTLLAELGDRAKLISPDYVKLGAAPPTFICHGRSDGLVPIAQAERFAAAMKKAGNVCELMRFPGNHMFYLDVQDPRGGPGGGDFRNSPQGQTIVATDRFLTSLGYLHGPPTLGPR